MELIRETSKQGSKVMSQTNITVKDYSAIEPGLFGMHLDMPGEKVNKINDSFMNELKTSLEKLKANSQVKALAIVSEKKNIFIAGADINLIKDITKAEDGERLAFEGQKVVQMLEQVPFPVVCGINGAAMGGGTEFALCCKYIVCSDSPSTKIALPEVNLGVLPGFGGTVRLPKRIGLQASLDYVLTGKAMDGKKAFKLGLAEAVLPHQDFNERVLLETARIIRGEKITQRRRPKSAAVKMTAAVLEKNPLGRSVLFSQARKMVMKKTGGHYPAPLKILDLMKVNAGANQKKALLRESKAFGELSITDVSKNCINLFFATEKIKKQTGVEGKKLDPSLAPKKIGLLGAGVMGGGIAQLLAHKNYPVRMKDIDFKGLGIGISSAQKLFSKLVKRRKMTKREAEMKLELISGTTDYSGFQNVDLVIEAVVENMDIKKKVLQEVEAASSEKTIFATNTSSLSVTEWATASSRPHNVAGMHFFNPVHRMPLIEVIRGEKSSDEAVMAVFELSKKLGKMPVVVKDGAGFLVNRLLMPYLNEACFIMSEGAPIELLDKEVVKFGMPMGPATLLDEVGLDVGTKVSKILHQAFGARAQPCALNNKLVDAKLLGKKSGKGFYIYDAKGKKGELNPDIYKIIETTPKAPTSMQKESWIPRMMYQMINEASLCLDEGVVAEAGDVDLGMIMGTGFPPFRGGLLRYADSVGLDKIVAKLEELSKAVGTRFTPAKPLVERARAGKKFYS